MCTYFQVQLVISTTRIRESNNTSACNHSTDLPLILSLRKKLLLMLKELMECLLCNLSILNALWQAASVFCAVRSRLRQYFSATVLQYLLIVVNTARVFTSTRSKISYATSSGSLSNVSAVPKFQKVQVFITVIYHGLLKATFPICVRTSGICNRSSMMKWHHNQIQMRPYSG